jgi:hypothetical protein
MTKEELAKALEVAKDMAKMEEIIVRLTSIRDTPENDDRGSYLSTAFSSTLIPDEVREDIINLIIKTYENRLHNIRTMFDSL